MAISRQRVGTYVAESWFALAAIHGHERFHFRASKRTLRAGAALACPALCQCENTLEGNDRTEN